MKNFILPLIVGILSLACMSYAPSTRTTSTGNELHQQLPACDVPAVTLELTTPTFQLDRTLITAERAPVVHASLFANPFASSECCGGGGGWSSPFINKLLYLAGFTLALGLVLRWMAMIRSGHRARHPFVTPTR